jgi:predicted phosphodiesterase
MLGWTMRIAALYDIHANLAALEAVLGAVDKLAPDLIVIGGDVAAGPMPTETITRLSGLTGPVRFVRGNADRYMVEAFDGRPRDSVDGWPASQLSQSHRDFLAGFEATVESDVDGLGRVLFCHATPESDDGEIITPATPDAVIAAALADARTAVIVAGHTHMQFDRKVGDFRLINTGSVGMPYADEGGAYWALLGPGVDLRRTAYDFKAAAAAVRATGYPDRESFAASIVQPPTADQATDEFERRAGRR